MILSEMMKDPWTYIASGFILVVQWVMTHADTLIGIAVGLLGIITLIYGIIEKIKKNKLLDLEAEIKRREINHFDRT